MIKVEFEKEIADILEKIYDGRESIRQGNIHITSDYDTIWYQVYTGELESNYVIIKKEFPHKPSRKYIVIFKKDFRGYLKEEDFIERNLSLEEINNLLTNLVYKIDSIITTYHKGDEKRARKEKRRQKKEAIAFIKSLFK